MTNASETEVTPIGRLVLARLLAARDRGINYGDLRKALEPLLRHRWTGAVLLEMELRQTLEQLASAGLIEWTRKNGVERGRLTPAGYRSIVDFLEFGKPPRRITWEDIRKRYLPALLLGMSTPVETVVKKMSRAGMFEAMMLKARFELAIADYSTLNQAIDALAWKLLGFEPGKKFEVKAVKAALLKRELGENRAVDSKADPRKDAIKLLAKKMGALQPGKSELGEAAIRQWIDRESPPPGFVPPSRLPAGSAAATTKATARATVSPSSPSPSPLDLETFAGRVREAARLSPTGRFGDNKVFVVHVWRVLREDPVFSAMGFDGFKRKLAEANNARRLDLSRADMVEAMNAEDVALSRVFYFGAEFHFVRI